MDGLRLGGRMEGSRCHAKDPRELSKRENLVPASSGYEQSSSVSKNARYGASCSAFGSFVM
jgi:hypothetical protein